MRFLKSSEKDKGITLIALVVTLLILLILAGTAMSLITWEGGLNVLVTPSTPDNLIHFVYYYGEVENIQTNNRIYGIVTENRSNYYNGVTGEYLGDDSEWREHEV